MGWVGGWALSSAHRPAIDCFDGIERRSNPLLSRAIRVCVGARARLTIHVFRGGGNRAKAASNPDYT